MMKPVAKIDSAAIATGFGSAVLRAALKGVLLGAACGIQSGSAVWASVDRPVS